MAALGITVGSEKLLLKVRVQPRASRTEVAGFHDGALKVRLTAPPLDDRANDQLLDFLSRFLKIPASHLALAAGRRSRNKKVAIRGISRSQLLARLAQETQKRA